MSYTPGPLMVLGRDGCFDILSTRGELIATVHGGNRAIDTANARLIAAAPDLVKALKELCRMDWRGEDNPDTWAKARAALEKAGVEL
jgi:hypothetical protein